MRLLVVRTDGVLLKFHVIIASLSRGSLKGRSAQRPRVALLTVAQCPCDVVICARPVFSVRIVPDSVK
jgi:hypothetical protein